MRCSLITLTPKRGLTDDETGAYIGCAAWFKDCVRAGWIKGIQRGRIKLYDIEDVDGCFNRIKGGDWPEV
jgi:hypothetical protein